MLFVWVQLPGRTFTCFLFACSCCVLSIKLTRFGNFVMHQFLGGTTMSWIYRCLKYILESSPLLISAMMWYCKSTWSWFPFFCVCFGNSNIVQGAVHSESSAVEPPHFLGCPMTLSLYQVFNNCCKVAAQRIHINYISSTIPWLCCTKYKLPMQSWSSAHSKLADFLKNSWFLMPIRV